MVTLFRSQHLIQRLSTYSFIYRLIEPEVGGFEVDDFASIAANRLLAALA